MEFKTVLGKLLTNFERLNIRYAELLNMEEVWHEIKKEVSL